MAGPSNITSVSLSSSLPTSPISAVEDSSNTRQEESVDCGDGKEDEQRTSDASKRTDESEVDKMEEMLASCIAETDNQTSREIDTQQHEQSEVMAVVSEDDASDNNSPTGDTVEKDEGEKELASESTTVVVPHEGEEKDMVKMEPPVVTVASVTSSSSSNEREEQSTLVTEREKETVPADGDRDKDTDNVEHIREVQFVCTL